MKKQSQESQIESEEFYEHKPKRELKASLSKDGKYWILKDVTTHIVSREYLAKIERSHAEGDVEPRSGNKAMGERNDKGNQ